MWNAAIITDAGMLRYVGEDGGLTDGQYPSLPRAYADEDEAREAARAARGVGAMALRNYSAVRDRASNAYWRRTLAARPAR